MKRTLIGLVIGIIIGFILAEVISPPYQVSSSHSEGGFGSLKINQWTGKTWVLKIEDGYKYYWEEISEKR